MVTNRQTDKQTNAGDYIIPRESFRGDNNNGSSRPCAETKPLIRCGQNFAEW